MGDIYKINILVRKFSESDIFGLQRYLKSKNQLMIIDAYSDDLTYDSDALAEERSFLEILVKTANKRGTEIIPMKSDRYGAEAIRNATPDIGLEGFAEAAVLLYERVTEFDRIFIKMLSPWETTIVIKPSGADLFHKILSNRYVFEKEAEADYSTQISYDPGGFSSSIIDKYSQSIFDMQELWRLTGKLPSDFEGAFLFDSHKLAIIDLFWKGLDERKRIVLEEDNNKILRK